MDDFAVRDGASGGAARSRLRLTVSGAVQGVGFRPFALRLAESLDLAGWVRNTTRGALLEVEGRADQLDRFRERLQGELPAPGSIATLLAERLAVIGERGFRILPSEAVSPGAGIPMEALMMPDIAPCAECLAEFRDPSNRRYRHAFICCTSCGPRYSVTESLPYDRQSTTMRHFPMCGACSREYSDPRSRRFHAQANCCPDCGPRLSLLDAAGTTLAVDLDAVEAAAAVVRRGGILAFKSVGGFQLIVDATNDEAVADLRRRKSREEKPLAIIFPSPESVRAECDPDTVEERLLTSPEAPIVLLRRRPVSLAPWEISPLVAPGSPILGVMLPATPLHHLLLNHLGAPVVATSGNPAEDPICVDNDEARQRLSSIADCFLVHDRRIAHRVDDSVVIGIAGREMLLRRARGYAPLPIEIPPALGGRQGLHGSDSILATGGHLKSTIALTIGAKVLLSPHIGDLGSGATLTAFSETIDNFEAIHQSGPALVACDAHPDYHSSLAAARRPERRIEVGHHHAHALACLADNGLGPPALAVVWDGAGYGGDGTLWGGEFLRVGHRGVERFAHWRQFSLPGGERAAREPWRAAIGLLWELDGQSVFGRRELPPLASCGERDAALLSTMLDRGINSPRTSAIGRLFDAVASLLGLRQRCGFEGQAAIELEHLASTVETDAAYRSSILAGQPLIIDWEPMLRELLDDLAAGISPAVISARFHNTLVESLLIVARRAGEAQVCLSGGCFQNRRLAERAVSRLREAGFIPLWHRRVPPNDGGLALGQAIAAAIFLAESRERPDDSQPILFNRDPAPGRSGTGRY